MSAVMRDERYFTRHRNTADIRLHLVRVVSWDRNFSAEDVSVHVTDSLLDIHQK